MRANTLLKALVLATLGTSFSMAQEVTAPDDAAEGQVRAISTKFVEAFNKGDVGALKGLFAEKSELIDEEGKLYRGPDAIEGVLTGFFEQFPGSQVKLEVDEVRFVSADLAIEDGTITITAANDAGTARNHYTSLIVHVGDQWLIGSMKHALEEPIPTAHDQLEPLNWLVGDWVSEGDSGRVELSCKWSEEENYLLATYTITTEGEEPLKTTQRLAWDAAHQIIRSWNFDTDGGFSQGEWSTDGSNWIVKSYMILPDGRTGSATFYLNPTDQNQFVWSSLDRVVGGIVQPPVEVTLVRKPPAPK